MVIEGSVKIARDAGVDIFVQIEFILSDFSDGLFLFEKVKNNKFRVVEPGIFQGLNSNRITKGNLWVLWSW